METYYDARILNTNCIIRFAANNTTIPIIACIITFLPLVTFSSSPAAVVIRNQP
jgi:hypothetical protein